MEHLSEKLRSSRTQLVHEGAAFFGEIRDAGRQFWSQTLAAGAAATGRTRTAGGHLLTAFRSEADSWGTYLRARQELMGDGVRELAKPQTVERRLLSTVRRGLSEIEGQLDHRLANLTVAPAETKRKRLPIGDYESLTAKDIVARLDALSHAEVKALYDHERRHKQRRTVLRAAKQRLAA